MSLSEDLLRRNGEFAQTADRSAMAGPPAGEIYIVACVDPRVDPTALFGLELGEAFQFLTPGGRITEDVINDIALLRYMGEFRGSTAVPREVAIVHHTGCGMAVLDDERFRAGFSARSGLSDQELAGRAVSDPVATVMRDVERLRTAPHAPKDIIVSGHVLDLATGLVTTVVAADRPAGGVVADGDEAET